MDASQKLADLQSQLTALETIKLPRLLARIEKVKAEIPKAEKVVEKHTEYKNAQLNVSVEMRELHKEFHRLDLFDAPPNSTLRHLSIAKQLAENLPLEVSERDLKILGLLASGETLKSVGNTIHLSTGTITRAKYLVFSKIRRFFKNGNG